MFCPILGLGKHAKIREFTPKGVYTGTLMQTQPFWTIKTLQKSLRSWKRWAQHNSSSTFCPMLSLGKHANRTIEVAKIREVTRMV